MTSRDGDFDPIVEAALHRLLASPARLSILHELGGGECTAGEIAIRVGLAQSPTSQHLARLRASRLVLTRKDKQVVHYQLAPGVHARFLEIRRSLGLLARALAFSACTHGAGPGQRRGRPGRARP